MELDYKQLKELIQLINNSSITEFKIDTESISFEINKNVIINTENKLTAAHIPLPAPNLPSTADHISEPVTVFPEINTPFLDGNYILSPMVGTFYTSASPEKPPIVTVGSKIKKDDVVCIIDTMKVMNEIKSGFNGEIAEVLVENAQVVEFHQKLFRVV